jgi:hypothetical protein
MKCKILFQNKIYPTLEKILSYFLKLKYLNQKDFLSSIKKT